MTRHVLLMFRALQPQRRRMSLDPTLRAAALAEQREDDAANTGPVLGTASIDPPSPSQHVAIATAPPGMTVATEEAGAGGVRLGVATSGRLVRGFAWSCLCIHPATHTPSPSRCLVCEQAGTIPLPRYGLWEIEVVVTKARPHLAPPEPDRNHDDFVSVSLGTALDCLRRLPLMHNARARGSTDVRHVYTYQITGAQVVYDFRWEAPTELPLDHLVVAIGKCAVPFIEPLEVKADNVTVISDFVKRLRIRGLSSRPYREQVRACLNCCFLFLFCF